MEALLVESTTLRRVQQQLLLLHRNFELDSRGDRHFPWYEDEEAALHRRLAVPSAGSGLLWRRHGMSTSKLGTLQMM